MSLYFCCGFLPVLGTHHIFVDVSRIGSSCCFIDASHVTSMFFPKFFPRHRRSASRLINFKLLKLVSMPIRAHTTGGQILHSLPSRHLQPHPSISHLPPILLAVKLPPVCPAGTLHPCWWPTSPLPTQRSSSTHLASGQALPSPWRREMRDGIQETRDEKRDTGDERRDIGCGVWVGVVVGGRGEVGLWVVMGGCGVGGSWVVVKGWGWGMRWWVELEGGGCQRGDPPPNKCREFPTYFCRFTLTRQRVIFKNSQHASIFSLRVNDALTRERESWRGCPALFFTIIIIIYILAYVGLNNLWWQNSNLKTSR